MAFVHLVLLAVADASRVDPAVQPVADVLARVLGGDVAAQFDLTLDPTMKQGFSLYTTAFLDAPYDTDVPSSSSSPSPVTVHVVASGLPELAYGCAYYLRTEARMSFAWERAGGNQVALPPQGRFTSAFLFFLGASSSSILG